MQLKLMLLALAACAACLAPAPSQALSIESEPVKVTHRNSGPRYDLDEELDKSKLTPVSEAPGPAAAAAATADEQQAASGKKLATNGDEQPAEPQEDQMPFGQVSIRRFLLVPVMRPARPDWQEEPTRESSERQLDHQQAPPTMFAKPFWPFLTPARPSHHLFGADEASRSPQAGREREREREEMSPADSQEQPAINPFQLMLEMMQQALNSQLAGSMPGDLSEGASSASERGNGEPTSTTSDEKPQVPASVKPQASNETREDIVEIEGKKYLRKTLINRHVGENIIFMTKRLIFVPLNETESPVSSNEQPAIPTSSTTEATPVSEPVESRASSTPAKPIEEETTSTTSTTTTTTTGAPTTVAASEPTTTTTAASISEQPSSSQKSSPVERVAGEVAPTISSTTSTTEKPTSS